MKTIITALFIGLITSQTSFNVDTEKSDFQVKGTSTVHDWESVINKYSVKGDLGTDQITNLVVEVTTNSIESGKSIMDDKTYEALKAEDYPTIKFTAPQLTLADSKVKGNGTLSLAGVDKKVSFAANATKEGEALRVEGSVKVVMSEYGIEPPTAMFGTLTCGDEVTIEFNFLLN